MSQPGCGVAGAALYTRAAQSSRRCCSMDEPDRLARFASQQLASILQESGQILYSSASTLSPGSVYLLGHNPGGSPQDLGDATIGRSIKQLPTKKTNSYLDEGWGDLPPGESVLQRRVRFLLDGLGLDVRSVAASNLIFLRSRDVDGVEFPADAELCWPVHERILEVVSPSVIIAFGNDERQSPYAFLREKYAQRSDQETRPAGHGNWRCKSFNVPGSWRVIGLPHLRRYAIDDHPEVIEWIKEVAAL